MEQAVDITTGEICDSAVKGCIDDLKAVFWPRVGLGEAARTKLDYENDGSSLGMK